MRSLVATAGLASGLCLGAASTASAQPIEACIAAHEAGQRARREGLLLTARAKMMTCDDALCPEPIQQDCAAWRTELEQEIPTVVFTAQTTGGEPVSEARFAIDGAAPQALAGRPVELDPGEHLVRVETANGAWAERRFVAVTGQRNQLVEVQVSPPMADIADPAEPAEAGLPLSFWIAGGVAVVGLGGFGILGAVGLSNEQELRDTCAGSCADEDVDDVETTYLVGDVMGIIGVTAAVTSAVIGIVHLSSGASTEPAATVRVGLGGASVSVPF